MSQELRNFYFSWVKFSNFSKKYIGSNNTAVKTKSHTNEKY